MSTVNTNQSTSYTANSGGSSVAQAGDQLALTVPSTADLVSMRNKLMDFGFKEIDPAKESAWKESLKTYDQNPSTALKILGKDAAQTKILNLKQPREAALNDVFKNSDLFKDAIVADSFNDEWTAQLGASSKDWSTYTAAVDKNAKAEETEIGKGQFTVAGAGTQTGQTDAAQTTSKPTDSQGDTAKTGKPPASAGSTDADALKGKMAAAFKMSVDASSLSPAAKAKKMAAFESALKSMDINAPLGSPSGAAKKLMEAAFRGASPDAQKLMASELKNNFVRSDGGSGINFGIKAVAVLNSSPATEDVNGTTPTTAPNKPGANTEEQSGTQPETTVPAQRPSANTTQTQTQTQPEQTSEQADPPAPAETTASETDAQQRIPDPVST